MSVKVYSLMQQFSHIMINNNFKDIKNKIPERSNTLLFAQNSIQKNCNVTEISVSRVSITLSQWIYKAFPLPEILLTGVFTSCQRLNFISWYQPRQLCTRQYMVCRNEYSADFISGTDVVLIHGRRHSSWLKSRSIDVQLSLQMPSVEHFDFPTNCYIWQHATSTSILHEPQSNIWELYLYIWSSWGVFMYIQLRACVYNLPMKRRQTR